MKICSSQLQAATRAEQQVRHPESHVCAGKTIPSAILVQLQAQVRAATRGADRKRILMGENKAGIWKRRAKQVRSSPDEEGQTPTGRITNPAPFLDHPSTPLHIQPAARSTPREQMRGKETIGRTHTCRWRSASENQPPDTTGKIAHLQPRASGARSSSVPAAASERLAKNVLAGEVRRWAHGGSADGPVRALDDPEQGEQRERKRGPAHEPARSLVFRASAAHRAREERRRTLKDGEECPGDGGAAGDVALDVAPCIGRARALQEEPAARQRRRAGKRGARTGRGRRRAW